MIHRSRRSSNAERLWKRLRPIPVIQQRTDSDCGVASLAMLLNVEYVQAMVAVRKVNNRAARGRRGMLVKEVIAAAKLLGHDLEYSRSFDPECSVGIVSVRGPNEWWHFCVLQAGRVIDTDGVVSDWRDFLDGNRARFCGLIHQPGDTRQLFDRDWI